MGKALVIPQRILGASLSSVCEGTRVSAGFRARADKQVLYLFPACLFTMVPPHSSTHIYQWMRRKIK